MGAKNTARIKEHPMKRIFCLFVITLGLSAADVVTVDPNGVLIVAGTPPAAPTATEVRIGGGQVSTGGPVVVTDGSGNALQVAGGAIVSGTATVGNVVVNRSTQAASTEVVRGDDPRMTNARPANGGNADTVDGKHAADLIAVTDKGAANGVATLDASGRIPAAQMPMNVSANGLREACRLASVTNVTLSGSQQVDGLTANPGDRVLLLGQTALSENGIYIVSAGVWSRAQDLDTSLELSPGFLVSVIDGKSLLGTVWQYVPLTAAPVLGADNLNFRIITNQQVYGSAVIAPGLNLAEPTPAGLFPAAINTTLGESWVFGIAGGVTKVTGSPWLTSPVSGQFLVGPLGGGRYRLSLRMRTFATAYSGSTGYVLMQLGFYKNGSFENGRYGTGVPSAVSSLYVNQVFTHQVNLVPGDVVDVRVYFRTNSDFWWNPTVSDWNFDIERIGDYPR